MTMPTDSQTRKAQGGAVNCFWPWAHHWEKWEIIEQGKILRHDRNGVPVDPPMVVGIYEYQKRVCLLCGKTQLREVAA